MFYITRRGCYLERQGDLVRRLIRGRTRITIGVESGVAGNVLAQDKGDEPDQKPADCLTMARQGRATTRAHCGPGLLFGPTQAARELLRSESEGNKRFLACPLLSPENPRS